MMAILSYETQLEQVQTAITNLLASDWVRMDVEQREVEKHRLKDLQEREAYLMARYKEELATGSSNSGIRVRGVEVDI